jgi:hypothetical protein
LFAYPQKKLMPHEVSLRGGPGERNSPALPSNSFPIVVGA